MKKYFFVIAAIVLFVLPGCKKDASTKEMNGKWELSTSGNHNGQTTNHAPGNGTFMEFKDNSYTRYENNQVVRQGSFSLKTEFSSIQQRNGTRIYFDGQGESIRNFVKVDGNKLTLLEDALGGGTATYLKIQ